MFRNLEATRKERAMGVATSDTVADTPLDRVDQIGRGPRTMAFIMVGENLNERTVKSLLSPL
jgi:hypothetical protein